MRIFYLSFADEQEFKGALVIAGSDFSHAVSNARALGLLPGGEVQVAWKDVTDFPEAPPEFVGRLLSLEDIEDWNSRVVPHVEVEMVARRLDLYWRSTCGYEPDTDHEITWHSFIGQAQAAIAAMKELNELLNELGTPDR